MDRYPLVSALSRPVIVRHLVAAARKHDATVVAHGCTGKGNDQVRFEVGIGALAPELTCIAPVRDYGMTRDKAIEFAERTGLPIDVTKKSPYSIDQNVWGRAVETGFLEDIWNAPIEDVYDYTADPSVPREPDEVVITFDRGAPVAIDGKPVTMLQAIQQLNDGPAPRASVASTWSRTAWSASRAARSTRRPAPSRSSPRTRSSRTSRSSATSPGSSVASSSGGASWSTTASGSAR